MFMMKIPRPNIELQRMSWNKLKDKKPGLLSLDQNANGQKKGKKAQPIS